MFKKIIINASILASTLVLIPLSSYASTYGSNLFTTGLTTYESGQYLDNDSSKAIDGNNATAFIPCNSCGTATWWSIDLGATSTVPINKLSFLNFYLTFTSTKFQGSNNNSTWTDITDFTTTQTDQTTWEHIYFNTATTTYRYYKINNTGTSGAGIAEIMAFTCTDCNVATSSTSTILSTNNFMSPELDQLLIYILEGLIVIGTGYGLYKFLK